MSLSWQIWCSPTFGSCLLLWSHLEPSLIFLAIWQHWTFSDIPEILSADYHLWVFSAALSSACYWTPACLVNFSLSHNHTKHLLQEDLSENSFHYPSTSPNINASLLRSMRGFPCGSVVENLPANAGDTRDTALTPGLGRFPGERNAHPLQYSCLENPMDRGAWQAIVYRVAMSQTWLSNWAHTQTMIHNIQGTHSSQLTHWFVFIQLGLSLTTSEWVHISQIH